MPKRGWSKACCWLLVMASASLSAAEPPDGSQGEQRWIEQLRHPEFAQREEAFQKLAELGSAAQAALQEAIVHESLEIRRQAKRLLALIDCAPEQQAAAESELAARLEAFVGGGAMGNDVSLPGWDRLHQIVGDSRDARIFYTRMSGAEASLLKAYQRSPRDAAWALEQICAWNWVLASAKERRYKPLASLATLALVAGDERVAVSPTTASDLARLLEISGFNNRFSNARFSRVEEFEKQFFRRLLARLVRRPLDFLDVGGNGNLAERLKLAQLYGLESEEIDLAAEVLRQGLGATDPIIEQAILVIAKSGNEVHAPLIARFLKDERLLNEEFQLRDLALLVLIHLSEEPFEKFGIFDIHRGKKPLSVSLDEGSSPKFVFPNPEVRQIAFDRWETWCQENGRQTFCSPLAE